jgi:hypothetical protein
LNVFSGPKNAEGKISVLLFLINGKHKGKAKLSRRSSEDLSFSVFGTCLKK